MSDIFNSDFQEFIHCLNQDNVEYVLVGGYAVIIYGYRRPTGDLDIFVNQTKENYAKLNSAFRKFGLSVFDMTEAKFLSDSEIDVFTFGRPPISIDIITKLKGIEFQTAFQNSSLIKIEAVTVRVIQKHQLIEVKKAAGRYRDLDDIEKLNISE